MTLTEEQTNKIVKELDDWTPEDAEQILTVEFDDIGIIRVFKEGKLYTLLRCFWCFGKAGLSVDKQEVTADTIIQELGTHIGSKL